MEWCHPGLFASSSYCVSVTDAALKEFRANCRTSLGVIDQQIRWLNDEVAKASVSRSQLSMPMIMRAIKEFEGVQVELRAVLQLYDALEQAGSDPAAQERAKNDYAIRLLASNPGRELGGGSHVPTRAPSPLDEERFRRVSNLAKTARGHADLLRDTVAFSSAEDLRGPLIEVRLLSSEILHLMTNLRRNFAQAVWTPRRQSSNISNGPTPRPPSPVGAQARPPPRMKKRSSRT